MRGAQLACVAMICVLRLRRILLRMLARSTTTTVALRTRPAAPCGSGGALTAIFFAFKFNDARRYMDWLLTVPLPWLEIFYVVKFPTADSNTEARFPGFGSALRQFYVAIEKDEWMLDMLCDLYEMLTITQAFFIPEVQEDFKYFVASRHMDWLLTVTLVETEILLVMMIPQDGLWVLWGAGGHGQP